MKKFTKICLIASVVLILIGGTICALGFISGGWQMMDEMDMDDDFWRFVGRMRSESTARDIRREMTEEIQEEAEDLKESVWEDIEDDIEDAKEDIKDAEDDVRETIQEVFSLKAPEGNGDTGIEAGQVKELEIKIGGAALCIMESGNNNFGVEIDGKGDYQYYESKGVFYLEGGKKYLTGNNNERVYLYIPQGKSFDNVKIDVGGGIINIDALNAHEVELDAGAGVIASEKISCKSLSVEVGAGEVVLEGIEADEIDIDVGMGTASMKGKVNREIDASCGMGYLALELDNEEADFNYEIECSAGVIDVGGQTYGALGKKAHVDNRAAGECSLECSMGSIEVTFTK